VAVTRHSPHQGKPRGGGEKRGEKGTRAHPPKLKGADPSKSKKQKKKFRAERDGSAKKEQMVGKRSTNHGGQPKSGGEAGKNAPSWIFSLHEKNSKRVGGKPTQNCRKRNPNSGYGWGVSTSAGVLPENSLRVGLHDVLTIPKRQ